MAFVYGLLGGAFVVGAIAYYVAKRVVAHLDAALGGRA